MRLACLLTLLLFVTACSTDRKPEPPVSQPAASAAAPAPAYAAATEPADTGLPAMHAIHNNRLQQAMDRINTLVYRQMRDEVNASVETRQQTQEVAKTASELSGTVEAIIATLPALRLNPGDQATFRALADKLRLYAKQMEEQANWNQIHAIPATMDAITSTCTSCHTLFRKNRSILEKCSDPNYTC
ncbi:hypothetical protein [Methylogaea oryzae]|uniref:Cytochrome C n=1 Tax=Methylogaea oryzae TaxID=1295382 RepID=A0A8D4VS90_9GAMM|nr:hypothetical protein [Methylogaea oryzae]BBL71425.1 hypothetical protein MoryE10_20310 [Methylogaea oryzae]